jgi:multiple sugar transport system substrate-binding protein
MFGQQLEDAKSPPAVPTWEQVADVVDAQLEGVVRGGTDPAEAAAQMQSRADSIGTGS